jgi:uncharacterized membrane protein YedE/YeeE
VDDLIGIPVLSGFFLAAVVMGVAISRTNFCTMGAVSDWVNLRDFGRLGAWMLAIVVTMLSVSILEVSSVFELDGSRPPYRSPTFAWLRYLLGGLMFGVGMTLAGGCVSKNLVRFGGGNLKSFVTLNFAAIFAYLMTKTVFFEIAFYNWIHPLSIDLSPLNIQTQDIGSIMAALIPSIDAGEFHVVTAIVVSVLVVWFILKTRGIRNNLANISAGLIIGGAVTVGWYLTAGPAGIEWAEAAEFVDMPPVGVGVQSFTFVNPLGEFISLFLDLGNISILVTAGMLAAVGLVAGSFADSLVSRQFRLSWFASFGDFVTNAIGGILMGIGGVLALGCTIGQGISGLSTLAVGSLIVLVAIIVSSAVTLKVQYYRLVYEDANFIDALLSGLVDVRLLPSSMRRLEAL